MSVRLADRCPISAAAERCTGKAHHGFRSTHAYIHMLCLGPDRYTCGQDVHEKRPGDTLGDTEIRRRASPPYSRQWLAKSGAGTLPTQPCPELQLKISRSRCAPRSLSIELEEQPDFDFRQSTARKLPRCHTAARVWPPGPTY